MSRYSLLIDNKTIYVDMRNISSAYGGGDAADVIAYDPASFVDIYSYASSGRDGSTAAKAYLANSGPTFTTKTANVGHPFAIPYKTSWPLIASLFDKSNGQSVCGYPISFVGVGHNSNTNKISIGYGIAAGKQEINLYGQPTYRVKMTVMRHVNGPTTYLQPSGTFGTSSYQFEFIAYDFCAGPQVSFSDSDITYAGAPCRFEIVLQTVINGVTSGTTRCCFKFERLSNDMLVRIDQSSNDSMSMYHLRYFVCSYGYAHLPALGSFSDI